MHFLPVFIITRIFKKTNYNNDNKKSNHQWSSLNHGTLNFNDILNDYVARVYTENKVKLFILSFVYPLPQILQRLCFYNIFFFLILFAVIQMISLKLKRKQASSRAKNFTKVSSSTCLTFEFTISKYIWRFQAIWVNDALH